MMVVDPLLKCIAEYRERTRNDGGRRSATPDTRSLDERREARWSNRLYTGRPADSGTAYGSSPAWMLHVTQEDEPERGRVAFRNTRRLVKDPVAVGRRASGDDNRDHQSVPAQTLETGSGRSLRSAA